jgi:3-oxoadipate enol-lactonase
MPYADLDAVRIHYALEGRADGPVLAFSHSLGADLKMWDQLMPTLIGRFNVLRYDMRGHGQSSAPAGPYTIADLGNDFRALVDHLNIPSVRFCGLSIGGAIGIWLGIKARAQVDKLVLANTAAKIGTEQTWNDRIQKVRAEGTASIARTQVGRWFTPEYEQAQPNMIRQMIATLTSTSSEGYVGCCFALRDMDFLGELRLVRPPTMVISGRFDPVAPPSDGHTLEMGIPGARYVELPSSHLSAVEKPAEFAEALLSFIP